jgi:hypothetical protein
MIPKERKTNAKLESMSSEIEEDKSKGEAWYMRLYADCDMPRLGWIS